MVNTARPQYSWRMDLQIPILLIALAALAAAIFAAFRAGHREDTDTPRPAEERLRLLSEQILAGQRAEAETTRRALADAERGLGLAIQTGTTDALKSAFEQLAAQGRLIAEQLDKLTTRLAAESEQSRTLLDTKLRDMAEASATRLIEIQTRVNDQLAIQGRAITEQLEKLTAGLTGESEKSRALLETKLREMTENNAAKLAEIQKSVNEQLHEAVEKQMTVSFQRVIDQFGAVQKAMGDVQAVTAQIGDIKRIFSNVKTRGGWGETQLRALLDDVLPEGGYEMNKKLRPDSDEMVEFALIMPARGETRPYLAVDAKFPIEDYERLITVSEAGDAEGERLARKGLEMRVRLEAKKIREKYIHPPITVDFAILYLPTDGLYAELARVPGLIADIGRDHRVMIMGPSLIPAMLRTVALGFVTLALEQKAGEVRTLLGATRTEMQKMGDVLEKLGKQAGTLTNTIELAQRRTRAVDRKLRAVEVMESVEAEKLLELDGPVDDGEPNEAG